MRCLGFQLEDESAQEGVMVQQKPDVHLKDGLRELVAMLQLLTDSIAPNDMEPGGEVRQKRMSRDDSDDEDDRFFEEEEEEDVSYGTGLTREDVEVQHKSHGQSFKFQPDFIDDPRRTDTIKSGGDYAESNEAYVRREASARQGTHTASTAKRSELEGATSKFANWQITPERVDFGVVRLGCTYRLTVALLNVSNTTGRIRIESKVLNDDAQSVLRVMHRPGEVAPGITKRLEVQFYAGDLGAVHGELTVATEQHTFRLPVSASVVSGDKGGMLPPLQKNNFSKTEGKFGPVGQSRLVSEVATPRTQQHVDSCKADHNPLPPVRPPSASRPLSGAASRPMSGLRSRPLSSRGEDIH
jgi:hypothetical protein